MPIDKLFVEKCLAFCQSKAVTERGLEIVNEIITSPPARRVNSRSMSPNLTSRFPSRKMGFTIQAESRSMELASIYIKEFDCAVMGYWDQPHHRPNLSYKSGSKNVRVPVTLDFFVISEEFIGFEECKPLEMLDKLSSKTPNRYCYDEASRKYQIPPLAVYLEGTGLSYRVVSEQHIDKNYVENLSFLYDLLDEPVTLQDEHMWLAAKKLVELKGGLTIEVLENTIEGLSQVSILTSIAKQKLYVDLYTEVLSDPEKAVVYASMDAINNENIDPEKLEFMPTGGSPREIEQAIQRLKIITPLIKGETKKNVSADTGISLRTIDRWWKSYKDGGLQALQPKHSKKGNYGSKLPKVLEDYILEVIDEYYIKNLSRKTMHVYQLLCSRCAEADLKPPSRQVFYARLSLLSDKKVLQSREGAKRAYQMTGYEGVENSDEESLFRGVTRFLERCHMDHTQIDIQLVSRDGVNLGKPWLTLIIDEYSGLILSVYLSFRSPGVPALMSAIRLMVKQHEVFPECIVVDGGKEFESIYFETLMARRHCTIVSRKGKPRAGGTVERVFGSINTIFLDNLSGNNKLAKNIRQLSASHNPKKLAVWEAVDFYHALLLFISDWNKKSIKSGGLSPAELRDRSIDRFGVRQKRKVKFDQSFLRDILPAPKRKTIELKRHKKIQLNRVSYWHACLRSISKEGESADIRYDPFDLNYIYVYHKNNWLKFRSLRQQHRQLDDLDAAIVAEVTRQILFVNEKAKSQGRMEMAVEVERLNKSAIDKKDETDSISLNKDEEDIGIRVDYDIWSVDIPDAEGTY